MNRSYNRTKSLPSRSSHLINALKQDFLMGVPKHMLWLGHRYLRYWLLSVPGHKGTGGSLECPDMSLLIFIPWYQNDQGELLRSLGYFTEWSMYPSWGRAGLRRLFFLKLKPEDRWESWWTFQPEERTIQQH